MTGPENRISPYRLWFLPAGHACNGPGLVDPYPGSLVWNQGSQTLASLVVEAVVQRVLYPLTHIKDAVLKQIRELHRAFVPDNQQERLNEVYVLLEELISADLMLTMEVAAMVLTDPLPPNRGVLEEIVTGCMVRAGLCCNEAADGLIAGTVGEATIADIERLGILPDWDPRWLTIDGAWAKWPPPAEV